MKSYFRLELLLRDYVDQYGNGAKENTRLNPADPFSSKIHSSEVLEQLLPRDSIKRLLEVHF